MKELYGWGRFPRVKANEVIPSSQEELTEILNNATSFIARGNGRSYGDSSINSVNTITTKLLNKFIDWDEETGELVAESGVLLSDVIKYFLPKGWFPFVTPGTKYITLGGAIACDVHGKNHHNEGSFGNFVNWIEVINDKNERIICSRDQNQPLFNWTIGGMGLTGVITKCSLQLKKVETGWINQKSIINNNLDETFEAFNKFYDSTYAVAWIDCLAKNKNLGRSILMLGEHSPKKDINKNKLYPTMKKKKFNIFFELPSIFLNNISVSLFNKIYFYLCAFKRNKLVDWDSYFYPLDSIGSWNKLYGRKGFFQFQCILPTNISKQGYREILKLIQSQSSGTFLAVLKNFGDGNSYLSFPEKGFTLALDFKATKKNILAAKQLTELVYSFRGKIYLAKDSLLTKSEFRHQFSNDLATNFEKFRNAHASSEQSKRIGL
tara:strand:- start:2795 stop:4102 length:1308 start_codon:yes stop_codon:yes gene_type:complete